MSMNKCPRMPFSDVVIERLKAVMNAVILVVNALGGVVRQENL